MKELNTEEKISFIVKTELRIQQAISKGHKCNDQDEFEHDRKIVRKYRIELGLIKDDQDQFSQ
jgi:hemerythrin superfamily protein